MKDKSWLVGSCLFLHNKLYLSQAHTLLFVYPWWGWGRWREQDHSWQAPDYSHSQNFPTGWTNQTLVLCRFFVYALCRLLIDKLNLFIALFVKCIKFVKYPLIIINLKCFDYQSCISLKSLLIYKLSLKQHVHSPGTVDLWESKLDYPRCLGKVHQCSCTPLHNGNGKPN